MTTSKRDLIRQAAYEGFRDFGYHEASVDAICERAGVSKGSFYYHYSSKQECFIDILETWSREVIEEVTKQFRAASRAELPFEAIAGALGREFHRGRSILPLWLEFSLLARRDPEISDALERFYDGARSAIADLLRPLVGSVIAEGELDHVSRGIFGMYMGVLVQELPDTADVTADAAAGAVLSVLGRIYGWLGGVLKGA